MRPHRLVIAAAALLCLGVGLSAQETGAGAAPRIDDSAAAQDAVVRDLLQRLDAQDAVNAELRQRIAALELLLQSNSLTEPQPPAAAVAAAIDETTRLEDRLDALPKVSGYFDFEYFKDNRPGTFNGFRQHRVFLDFFKEYQKFRVMSEVEFESAALVAGGPAGLDEPERGKVSIEQTWAEYVLSDVFTTRVGFILTPNYWNVNAYANVTASTQMPLIVRTVFPESFVGVMAYGTKYWSTLNLGYTAYVSNGQGADLGEHDDNSAKAVGGVLRFELPTRGAFETLHVNATGYSDVPAQGPATHIWGLESQARRGPFELLFEYSDRHAEEDARGAYAQPSYRVNDRLTVFYRYDRLRIADDGPTQAHTGGLHYRPITPVSFKFELFSSTQPGTPRIFGLASSMAVAF